MPDNEITKLKNDPLRDPNSGRFIKLNDLVAKRQDAIKKFDLKYVKSVDDMLKMQNKQLSIYKKGKQIAVAAKELLKARVKTEEEQNNIKEKNMKKASSLSIKMGDLFSDNSGGDKKTNGDKKAKLLTGKDVVKDNGDSESDKKRNVLLEKIFFISKAKGKGLVGLLGGLSLLVGVGGLLGFLMTGKTEFLFSVAKGFTKFGKVMISKLLKPFSVAFKGIFSIFGKLFGKTVVGKVVGKGIGKIAKIGKTALKKIPGIGLLMGIAFGIKRFTSGDIVGGLLELGSGIASVFPGVGTLISVAIDALILARDFGVFGGSESEELEKSPTFISKIGEGIKGVAIAIKDFVVNTLVGIKDLFLEFIPNTIKKVFSMKNIKEKLKIVLSKGQSLFAGIAEWIAETGQKAKPLFIKAIKTHPLGWLLFKVIDKFTGGNEVEDQMKGVGAEGELGLASGGIITRPTRAIVGERAKEAVIPLNKMGEVYSRLVRSGGLNLSPTATDERVLQEMRNRDLVGEHLENLKGYLSNDFIPDLANRIVSGVSESKKEGIATDVGVPIFG